MQQMVNGQLTEAEDDISLSSITDNTTTPGYVYFCEAAPGTITSAAAWRISRLNNSNGYLQWAAGNSKFDNIADNRAALSYS